MEVYVLGERGEQDYDWSAPDVIIAVYGDKESAINTVKELINVNVYQKEVRRIEGLNKTAEKRNFKKRYTIKPFDEWYEHNFGQVIFEKYNPNSNAVLDLWDYFIEEAPFHPAS